MVEHRADENLGNYVRAAEIPGHQGHPGGKPAAGAGASHDDPPGIDAQFRGMRRNPGETLVAVFDQRAARHFRRQPIVERRDHRPVALEPLKRDIQVGEAITHHHAAAMHPVDAGRPGKLDAGRTEDR